MTNEWVDTPLELGETEDGEYVEVDGEIRSTHMHVVGRPGTGKTKFLEHMIRQDIENGEGVCLLDPTGNLYDDLVRWCETHYLHEERDIILLDPTAQDWTFGFNPLNFVDIPGEDLSSDEQSFGVGCMITAIGQAWGGEDIDETPRLARILPVILHTLAEHRLTLADAPLLMHPDPNDPIRKYLSHSVKNPVIRSEWNKLNALKQRDFESTFESASNRLFRFLEQPRIHRMLGQQAHAVDFRKLMDEGAVLLINLSPRGKKIYKHAARLLGSLMVSDIVLKARGRPKGSRPFYLYIDECQRYVNDDIAEILNEMRQFGLHLVLAHQHLTQLQEASEVVYSSVMASARTKVVFQTSYEDAIKMAPEIHMGEIDYEEPKHALDKPAATGEYDTIVLRGEGENQQRSKTSITSSADSWSKSSGGEGDGASSEGGSRAGSEAEAVAYGKSKGQHEAREMRYKTMTGGLYTKDEQYNRAAERIGTLENRHAIVKVPGEKTHEIMVPEVEEGYANDGRVERFKEQAFDRADFARPALLADEEINKRVEDLRERANFASYNPITGDVIEEVEVEGEREDDNWG